MVARLAIIACLVACGAPDSNAPDGSTETSAPLGDHTLLRPAPEAFAALPCLGTPRGSVCAIVRAGGKSLLFGAPEGVAGALEAAAVSEPDGVFLFMLEGDGTEGLLRLRNQTWLVGRTAPLPVAGPEGTARLLGHLDKAMERSDALVYLRQRPAGRLGAAVFATVRMDGRAPQRVFDSGDLKVTAYPDRAGHAHYEIAYGDRTLLLLACPASGASAGAPDAAEADRIVACGTAADGTPVWPLDPPGLLVGATETAGLEP